MDHESKNQAMSMFNAKLDKDLNFSASAKALNHYEVGDFPNNDLNLNSGKDLAIYKAWDYYERQYYPYIVKESYPVYIQERAIDKGKQAFEIIKTLTDKKLLKLDTVKDFIDCMDTLIKTL